ncbi:MAG: hypothetical protein IPM84_19075 [Anaerolineae bacterium]|nr:hypothetical protein [Anaerolineae bacterium]
MTNYDYWAAHSFFDSSQRSEKAVIDYLLKATESPYPHDISDLSARVALSALSLLGDKEYARTGTRREPGGLSELYKRQVFQDYLHERLQHYRDQIETLPDLSLLPAGSFSISLRFTLTSPYLSKDDTALHLLDNPVKKEWVFKLPYVASTQWKGALRAAVRQRNDWGNGEPALLQLFGAANDNDDSGEQGRLYFYPTFFDRLSLEVINPHDRTTGAGSQPILMECVPAGTTGAFTLLYTPLDRIGQDEAETRRQVFAELQLVAAGLEAMLTVYGFGAKTSSGFGLAELNGEGQLVIHYPDAATTQKPRPQAPAYPESVQRFLAGYPAEYLDMKPNQLKDAGVPNSVRQQTKEAKALYQEYQGNLASYQAELADWEAATATPPAPMTTRSFRNFAELTATIASLPWPKEQIR